MSVPIRGDLWKLRPTKKETRAIIAGGALALCVGLVIGAVQIMGIISMGLAHVLIFAAWLVAVLAVWLIESQKYTAGIKVTLIVGLGIALLLLDRWMVRKRAELDAEQQKLVPEAISNSQPQKDSPAFSVEVRSAAVSGFGPITSFMVTYPSLFGQTASPVFYLLFVQITNLQDIASTVSEFKVAVSKDQEDPWEELESIPLELVVLYWLGPPHPKPTNLQIGHDTLQLLGGKTEKEMEYAVLVRPDLLLESEIAKPIQPHAPIWGWVAFDSTQHWGKLSKGTYFRVTLHDTAGKGGEYVTPLPFRSEGGLLMHVNTGSLFVTGDVTDISSFHLKYYSDPFVRPGDR